MLIPMNDLTASFKLDVRGIIHAGAHLAEEYQLYADAGVERVIWIEADPVVYEALCGVLRGKPGDNVAVLACVSDEVGRTVTFNLANNEQSSSMLQLGTHAQQHPDVVYVGSFETVTTTIDHIMDEVRAPASAYNFLVMDLQGAEMLALKGSTRTLENMDYLYLEVNEDEVYEGCALLPELDAYLADFTRVAVHMTVHGWGDAFWIRTAAIR